MEEDWEMPLNWFYGICLMFSIRGVGGMWGRKFALGSDIFDLKLLAECFTSV